MGGLKKSVKNTTATLEKIKQFKYQRELISIGSLQESWEPFVGRCWLTLVSAKAYMPAHCYLSNGDSFCHAFHSSMCAFHAELKHGPNYQRIPVNETSSLFNAQECRMQPKWWQTGNRQFDTLNLSISLFCWLNCIIFVGCHINMFRFKIY